MPASSTTPDTTISTSTSRSADGSRTSPTEQVVLLDDRAVAIGTVDKAEVHTTSTPLHLAFSVHVRDPATGRVLMTRRALGKRTWPGVWTNAFCGHPMPGEAMPAAIARRAAQELHLSADALSAPVPVLPDFRYRAVDAGGIVENEVCPVHVVDLLIDRADLPAPQTSEVMDVAWARWEDVCATAASLPHLLSPWLVLQAAQPDLSRALAG